MKKVGIIAIVLVMLMGVSVYASNEDIFTDVSDNAYYAEAIKWALANGITNGRGDGTFGVGSNVTRAEAVTFLWRSAGRPTPKTKNCPFVDVESDTKNNYWYRDAVIWANENGITTGTSATTFSPNDSVTRGQLITFLYRTKGGSTQSGSNWYTAAEQWANNKGLLTGTAQPYKNDSQCPRCDTVYYLWREMQSGNSGNTSNDDSSTFPGFGDTGDDGGTIVEPEDSDPGWN